MATFPRTEPQTVALAQEMVTGLTANAAVYSDQQGRAGRAEQYGDGRAVSEGFMRSRPNSRANEDTTVAG